MRVHETGRVCPTAPTAATEHFVEATSLLLRRQRRRRVFQQSHHLPQRGEFETSPVRRWVRIARTEEHGLHPDGLGTLELVVGPVTDVEAVPQRDAEPA